MGETIKKMKEISIEEFNEIIKNHQHFLNQDVDNWDEFRAEFNNVIFTEIDVVGKNLDYVNFIDCYFTDVKFKECSLEFTRFRNGQFSYVKFLNSDLLHCNFDKGLGEFVQFVHCNIHNSDFLRFNVKNIILEYNDLIVVTFRDSEITRGNLYKNDFNLVKFLTTDIIYSKLEENYAKNNKFIDTRFITTTFKSNKVENITVENLTIS